MTRRTAPIVRRSTFATLAAAVALVGAACAPSAAPQSSSGEGAGVPDKITIGSTLPLTGSESRAGGFFKQGYQLAFDEVEQAGGLDIGGKKVAVELKLLDDTSDQSKAVNLAERLVSQDHVAALLGTYSTSLTQAQSVVPERLHIPYVEGGGAATAIFKPEYKWVFGALAPVTQLGSTEMKLLKEAQDAGKLPKPSKIALVWENTSHGQDFQTGVTESAGDSFKVLVNESFELDSKDFSAVLNKIEAAKVDVVMVDAHLPDFITMQRQYVSRHMCHAFLTYGARGSESDAADALGQKNVTGIVSAVWWNAAAGSDELNQHFISAFKEKYGSDPEWYQALAYTAAKAMFTAIESAGSVDPEKVRTALENLHMKSIVPGGELSFPASSNHQAVYPFIVQQNKADGSAPVVFPHDLASAHAVIPNPQCKG